MKYQDWMKKCRENGYISREETAALLGMAAAQNVEELCNKNGIEVCVKPIMEGDGIKKKHVCFLEEAVKELVEKRKQIAMNLSKSTAINPATSIDIEKIKEDLAKEITAKILDQLRGGGLRAVSM